MFRPHPHPHPLTASRLRPRVATSVSDLSARQMTKTARHMTETARELPEHRVRSSEHPVRSSERLVRSSERLIRPAADCGKGQSSKVPDSKRFGASDPLARGPWAPCRAAAPAALTATAAGGSEKSVVPSGKVTPRARPRASLPYPRSLLREAPGLQWIFELARDAIQGGRYA